MKSVLISVDFIYKQDGTLHATELNTNTKEEITFNSDLNDSGSFVEVTQGYFDQDVLHSFMVNNSLTKLKVISQGGHDRLFKMFAEYHGFEYERVVVAYNQVTVPEVEDADDTLIIRIAYDTYALIDDLYARDNYEFHNLIQGESFSNPVTFKQNGFDTISEFEPSQDGEMPNYVIKARTPGYIATDFPRGYRLDTSDELNSLKESLTDDEFLTRFEYNNSLSLVENRTHHLRTMSLICGSNLDVLNLIHYKSMNSVSVANELLTYDSEIDSNKKLNDLFISKYYPTWFSKTGLRYHSDSTDMVLKPDNSLVSFSDLQIGDDVKYIFFNEEFSSFETQDANIINNLTTGTSNVLSITNEQTGLFVDIVASHETYGQLSWYDGIGNRYVIKKSYHNASSVTWDKAGVIEIGDQVMVYNNDTNEVIALNVESVSYSIKDLNLYLVGLTPKPEFLVRVQPDNDSLYLIQHNACFNIFCNENTPAPNCSKAPCFDCGKNSPLCHNCGGSSTVNCDTI